VISLGQATRILRTLTSTRPRPLSETPRFTESDSAHDPVVIGTKAEYEALTEGSSYKWTDGQIYTKRKWFGAGGVRKVVTAHTNEERAKIRPGYGYVWTDNKMYIKVAPGAEGDNSQDAKHVFEKASLE
jgi:hypothetical protein